MDDYWSGAVLNEIKDRFGSGQFLSPVFNFAAVSNCFLSKFHAELFQLHFNASVAGNSFLCQSILLCFYFDF